MKSLNRLWVRISFVLILVILFGMLFPIAFGIAMREFQIDSTASAPPTPAATANWQPPVNHPPEQGRNPFPGRPILENMAPLLLVITAVSILVGVLLSRNLSAPLSKLAEVARSLGRRDLSQRVTVRGSQEIQELALAFNQMAADLQQAETLRRNLLADVAHELRTPVTVIQGNLQAILDDVYELDKAEIARLYDQTRQLSHLVDDLHELALAEARQLPLQKISVDVKLLLEETAAAYAPIAEAEGIVLHADLSEGLLIQGDRARLMQCLHNLLSNAIRHTPLGGVVTVASRQMGEAVEIRVGDTGSGIAPEHLPHVFDRFYRADPARSRQTGGAGLGLAITRAIIEAHGGQISAVSEGLGLGSEFIIQLPLDGGL